MQRDNYAAITRKWRYKKTIPIPILHFDGKVRIENVYDEVFKGFEVRRLALVRQGSRNGAGPSSAAKEMLVSNMEQLERVHTSHSTYALLPLLCADAEAFAAAQGVCSSAGSPFTIYDRVDSQVLSLNFTPNCNGRDEICRFFAAYGAVPAEAQNSPPSVQPLPLRNISFDALLYVNRVLRVPRPELELSPEVLKGNSETETLPQGEAQWRSSEKKYIHAATYINVLDTLSESDLNEARMRRDFYHSPLYTKLGNNSSLQRKLALITRNHHYHVLACKMRIGAMQAPYAAAAARTHRNVNRMTTTTAATTLDGGFPKHYSEDGTTTVMGEERFNGAEAHARPLVGLNVATRRLLLQKAKEYGIFVYEKIEDGTYQYATV